MKNILFTIPLFLFALVSCKKDNDMPLADNKKYDVRFVVEEFTQQQVPLPKGGSSVAAAGDTLANHAKYLYYYVYNESGNFVKSMEQHADSANFGRISDKLSPGTYTFVFFAAPSKQLFWGTEKLSNFRLDNEKTEDFFVKKLQYTVSSTNTGQAVRLERIIAAIDVTIEDEFPEYAASINIYTGEDASFYYFGNEQPSSLTKINRNPIPLKSRAKGQTFSVYMLNTEQPVVIFIMCYTDLNQSIGNRIAFKRVVVNTQKNKRTQLSGKLFEYTGGGFQITFDRAWDSPFIINI